jgi:2-polyprenyl-3-methyl-5-hydroxy-6-metoxy-1,4-benzoquinol methylase
MTVYNSMDPQSTWPESWQLSQKYDELELYGSRRHLGYTYAYDVRKRQIYDLISHAVEPGERIIDIAAAQGNFTIALAEAGYHVTWNDIRAELIDFVKLKYSGPRVDFCPGNVFDLRANGQYDAALVSEVIEHVAHPDQFLAHIAGLVRPGGAIVLTTPNGGYVRNRLPRFSECREFEELEATQFAPDADGHIFLLHSDEVRLLANSAGLDVLELRRYANPITCGYLGTGPLLRVLPREFIRRLERVTERLPVALSERINTGLAALLRKS